MPRALSLPNSPARQLAGFVARFDPAVAKTFRSCRAAVRRLMPTAVELVYDNYQFLAVGYSTTERPSDSIVSLACSARGVVLSFYYGASLSDPDGILLGSGNQNRFVRLAGPETLRDAAVARVIRAAVAQATPPLHRGRKGHTIIQSVSAKQRPRR